MRYDIQNFVLDGDQTNLSAAIKRLAGVAGVKKRPLSPPRTRTDSAIQHTAVYVHFDSKSDTNKNWNISLK